MLGRRPHPLEGTALLSKSAFPRTLRPSWERRAASPRIGDAFAAVSADPAQALRRSAVAGGVLAAPLVFLPAFEPWPLVLLVSLLLALHGRCRRPAELLVILIAGQVAHWLPALAIGALLHG